jgi:DNA helicase II / ATP-dependent DNA helicase PcrA
MFCVTDLLSHLNEHQRQAVLHQQGPAIVLAGAGSGKTTVLTTRAAWLLTEQAVPPEALLVVTFTNKAASELKERIFKLTGSSLPYAGTFHSLCAKILRRDGFHIGLTPNFAIYDTDDQAKLLKEIYKTHGFDPTEVAPKAVAAAISKAKNEVLNYRDYQEIAQGSFQKHVGQVFELYQKALAKAQAVDFDDLLLKALYLLQEKAQVRQSYQELLTHILVDEYQDTNKVQYLLTKLLTQPHDNLYVVGDFSQSIYAWRGADYRNMMLLKRDFKSMSEYRLEQNYRSNQTILDAATAVISNNTSHPILELWTEQTAGNTITCYEAETGQDEAWQVVRYINHEHQHHPYQEMAILYRTNAQSRAFEEALIKSGIPYRLIGGTKFYERKEIKDVLAYLRYLANDVDIVSYQRLVSLGKRRLATFEAWLTNETREKALTMTPSELLRSILETTNYLDKFSKKTEEDLARKDNVYELLNVAAQFENLTQFLENVALIQNDYLIDQNPDPEAQNNQVNLMSLHAAKGLEFEVVFMVGMEDGLLPHSRSLLEKTEMEEERRLCYVGITRAKSKLYMTHARSRYQYGYSSNALRSRFLADIPAELMEFQGGDRIAENRNSQGWSGQYAGQYSGQYSSKKGDKSSSQRRYVPLDDDLLEGVLHGEIDIDRLLE